MSFALIQWSRTYQFDKAVAPYRPGSLLPQQDEQLTNMTAIGTECAAECQSCGFRGFRGRQVQKPRARFESLRATIDDLAEGLRSWLRCLIDEDNAIPQFAST